MIVNSIKHKTLFYEIMRELIKVRQSSKKSHKHFDIQILKDKSLEN